MENKTFYIIFAFLILVLLGNLVWLGFNLFNLGYYEGSNNELNWVNDNYDCYEIPTFRGSSGTINDSYLKMSNLSSDISPFNDSGDGYLSISDWTPKGDDGLLVLFNSSNEEILKITYDGDVYHKGRLVGNNESLPDLIADAFNIVVEGAKD